MPKPISLKNKIFYSIVGIIFLVGAIIAGFVFFYTKNQFFSLSKESCEYLTSTDPSDLIIASSKIIASTTAVAVFFAALVSALIVSLLLHRLFDTFEKTKAVLAEVEDTNLKNGVYQIDAETIKKFHSILLEADENIQP